MKFFWWTEPENFGDVLTPFILDYLGVDWSKADTHAEADAISTGSVARLALAGQIVLGSGIMRAGEWLTPWAKWRFVRGPLTRETVLKHGGKCPAIYGDPALLLPLFCQASEKTHKVGLVPHYQDYASLRRYGDSMPVIDVVNKDALATARQISACEKIISTSLHGIIAAHAYGIPAAYVSVSKLHGDGVKFDDYYASVGLEKELSTIAKPIYSLGTLPDLEPIMEAFRAL